MMRTTHRYHQTEEQALTQQQAESLRRLKDPTFLKLLQSIKTKKVGTGHMIITDNSKVGLAAAMASYRTVLVQSKKPLVLARVDARASAKQILEQYECYSTENMRKVAVEA